MGLASEETRLNVPVRRAEVLVVLPKLVTVFDDAADFDVGQREDLSHELDALSLLYQLVVRLPGEGNDCSVGMDGSALDVVNIKAAAFTGMSVVQLDVTVLFAPVGKDFESDIDAERVELVVGRLLAKEIDGGCAWNLRLRGHGELF